MDALMSLATAETARDADSRSCPKPARGRSASVSQPVLEEPPRQPKHFYLVGTAGSENSDTRCVCARTNANYGSRVAAAARNF